MGRIGVLVMGALCALSGCSGEQFTTNSTSGGAGGAAGAAASGGSNVGGTGGSNVGGTGGATGGTGGATGGTGGATGGTGGATGGTGGTCAGLCVPAVPSGFEGPLAIAEGGAGGVASCTGPFNNERFAGQYGLNPGVHCSCSCSNPQCTTVTVTAFSDNTCGASCASDVVTSACEASSTGSCAGPPLSVQAEVTASCTPKGTLPTPTWTGGVRVCENKGSLVACNGNGLCVPSPTAPYQAGKVCVGAQGNQACPSNWPNKNVFGTGFQDNRTCPCTCDTSCGTIDAYANASTCNVTPLKSFMAPSDCVQGVASLGIGALKLTPNAACTVPNASPGWNGSVAVDNAYTVCCL